VTPGGSVCACECGGIRYACGRVVAGCG